MRVVVAAALETKTAQVRSRLVTAAAVGAVKAHKQHRAL
jgi:hypothetical protein